MYGVGLLRLLQNRNDEFVSGAIYLYIDQIRHFLRPIIRKHEADIRIYVPENFWVTHDSRQTLMVCCKWQTFLASTACKQRHLITRRTVDIEAVVAAAAVSEVMVVVAVVNDHPTP